MGVSSGGKVTQFSPPHPRAIIWVEIFDDPRTEVMGVIFTAGRTLVQVDLRSAGWAPALDATLQLGRGFVCFTHYCILNKI